jgi:RimJ/RimL family protein N-acetyltransferase
MLVLRNMHVQEYPAYCQYFIDDYSNEIVKNYGYSIEVAIEMAKNSLQHCFPDGLKSNDHDLLCIEATVNGKPVVVGYLLHSINIEECSTFIYDFYVDNAYRGQGFGKKAISALESQIQLVGIEQIKLRVAYYNDRALKLYQDVGFTITGFNMSKKLSKVVHKITY